MSNSTSSAGLLVLAERCEAATGPDPELDAAIDAEILRSGWAYADTRSLDAAITLVPEDRGPLRFFSLEHDAHDGARWIARFDSAGDECGHGQTIYGEGNTPALALCAAALRARALKAISTAEKVVATLTENGALAQSSPTSPSLSPGVGCEHTPGPWQFFPSVSPERSGVIDTAIGVDSTNGTIIAEVVRGKQFEANARLIAAAPDMFEALRRIAEMTDIEADFDGFEAREIAIAALARAKGDRA